jgi:hypothetical protein
VIETQEWPFARERAPLRERPDPALDEEMNSQARGAALSLI